MMKRAVTIVALFLAAGTFERAAAQSVRVQVQVDVQRQVLDEIRRIVDRDVVRVIGADIRKIVRDADGTLPWLEDIAGAGWSGQDRDFRAEQTDKQTRTLALGPAGSLELRNVSGPITVTAGPGRDVTIEIIRISRGRTEADAKTGLSEVTVEVDHRGERATVNARYPQRRGRSDYSVSTSYTVTAPPGTHVTAGGFSTDVILKGIKGDLAVNVLSGAITISGASRISSARTLSGRVAVSDVEGDGNIAVGSMSGDVTLDRVKVRQLNADNMTGSVTARDITAENVSLSTMNGGIEYSGGISKTGRYEMKTHNGPIRLIVSGGGFDLDARTFSGRIAPDPDIQIRNVNVTRTSLKGTVGSGGGVIIATTFSGNVVITKK
jgi:Putative adhesin